MVNCQSVFCVLDSTAEGAAGQCLSCPLVHWSRTFIIAYCEYKKGRQAGWRVLLQYNDTGQQATSCWCSGHRRNVEAGTLTADPLTATLTVCASKY